MTELVRIDNNSIFIQPKSLVEQSYGYFYDRKDVYESIIVGAESKLTGSYTFGGIQAEKIVINEGCSIFGYGVFSRGYCRELEIHKDTVIYGAYSFQYCSYLNRIEIHKNVIIRGNHVFSCCSMTELILGNGINLIGTGIFNECERIEHLVIPDGAIINGISIFARCKNLKTIRFGNNVSVYGHSIFLNCESLEALYFGDNVRIYGSDNFVNCPNIQTIEHGQNFINNDETLTVLESPYKRVRFENIKEEAECSICIESFNESSDVVQTVCGHLFDERCLREWFSSKGTCPMCRKKLKHE